MGHLQRRNQKIKSLFSFQHQTQPFSSLQKKIQTALIFSASNPTRFHLLGIKPNPFPSSEPQTQPVPIFLASNPTLTHLLSVPNPFISFQHQTQPAIIASEQNLTRSHCISPSSCFYFSPLHPSFEDFQPPSFSIYFSDL